MADNSDYKKPRTNLVDLLPEVLRSGTNKAVFENIFNRFLTKPELQTVSGTVGKKNLAAKTSNQLREPTIHRQGFQLQPVMYEKIATIEHIAAYYDLLLDLQRQGVDLERLPEWGNSQRFNFVPPINLDKLINYTDYYWYNPQNPGDIPQYITIENRCSKITAQFNQRTKELNNLIAIRASQTEIDAKQDEVDILLTEKLAACEDCAFGFDTAGWDDGGNFTDYDPDDDSLFQIPSRGVNDDPGNPPVDIPEDWSTFGVTNFGENPWPGPGSGEARPRGIFGWDLVTNCSILEENLWQKQNKWLHRSDVPNLSIAKQAAVPIIEFFSTVELNEWTITGYTWNYRQRTLFDWNLSPTEPTNTEILAGQAEHLRTYQIIRIDPPNDQFWVLGNVTSTFPVGLRFTAARDLNDLQTYWTVGTSMFDGIKTLITTVENLVIGGTDTIAILTTSAANNTITVPGIRTQFYVTGSKFQIIGSTGGAIDGTYTVLQSIHNNINTTITTVEDITSNPIVPGIVFRIYGLLSPIAETSNGDPWKLFFTHWAFVRKENTFPTGNQLFNPNVAGTKVEQFTILPEATQDTFVLLFNTYLAGNNDVRVYVNGAQQFGTYEEGTFAISFIPTTTTNQISNAIRFFIPLTAPEDESVVVRIEMFAAVVNDIPRERAFVRTELNDMLFATSGPILVSLIRFRNIEQIKIDHTQYPLFNIYRVDGAHTGRAEPLFTYRTSETAPIDPNTLLRLVRTGRNFEFEHPLVEDITNALLCFKDTLSIVVDNPEGLQTIWRRGLNNENYIPRKVNENALGTGDTFTDSNGVIQTVNLGPGEGDWEIAEQWFFNIHHELRKIVQYDQLFTHFKTIIDEQSKPIDFLGTQADLYRTLENTDINFGLGGKILEHNDSFDTLYSATFIETTNPLAVLDFARVTYENNINNISDFFQNHIIEFLNNQSDSFILDLQGTIADTIIDALFELNDTANVLFGDSITFNETTQKGIRNWITTLPFLCLVFQRVPYFIQDEKLGIFKLIHHDGHYAQTSLEQGTINALIRTAKTTLTPFAQGPSGSRPGWPVVLKAHYFFDTQLQKLFKFNVIAVQANQPSAAFPNGTLWLDQGSGVLMVRDTGSPNLWEPVTGIVNNLDFAWVDINLNDLFVSTVLGVETRLWEAIQPFTTLALDFDNEIFLAPVDQALFNDHLQRFFLDFALEHGFVDPFGPDFAFNNAFTWNYKTVNVNDVIYPTSATNTTKPWGARWWTIYKLIYNTSYPHLEPWRLQGYEDEPSWWGPTYNWTTDDSRRWEPAMWVNLEFGIVPAGELLSDGITVSTGISGETAPYTHFCVNTTGDATTDGFRPDDLLPPYWTPPSTNPLDLAVQDQPLIRNIAFVPTNDIDNSYVFGDEGPVEFQWIQSARYLYDRFKAAYLLQPARFLDRTFGIQFTTVAGLRIDKRLEKVFSHKDTIFHGDVIDVNKLYKPKGINQWFVFYHRFHAFDINSSDFRQQWTQWDTLLSYQTATFFDTQTLLLSSDHFSITDSDFFITIKVAQGDTDLWIDSLIVTLLDVGTWNRGKNLAHDWTFLITSPTPISREVGYFFVNNFECTVDVGTNIFTIITPGRTIPWDTGDGVTFSTTNILPVPLKELTTFFVIRLSNTTFKIASTQENAGLGLSIDITTAGVGVLFVNELLRTFDVLSQVTTTGIFSHYAIDTRETEIPAPFRFPIKIVGVQNVVNLIDGYVTFQNSLGVLYNDSSVVELDPTTNQPVSWQIETERFINAFYGFARTYFARPGGAQVALQHFNHEVNPFRNNLWINHSKGVITDIITRPFLDIRTQQGTFDQYARPLTSNHATILREDNRSRILIAGEIANDVEPLLSPLLPDPYNLLHLGGAHLFLNTYEHIIMFNNYTVGGNLIYDPFVGLNHAKLNIQFDKQLGLTNFRPNIGGYFIRGHNLLPNVENTVDGIQKFYDTFRVNEAVNITRFARALLGFEPRDYFRQLGITPKSEFVFWRGLIQQKGTNNMLTALANLRSVTDIQVDEFWAFKVAEFGDSREKNYFEVHLDPEDTIPKITRKEDVQT